MTSMLSTVLNPAICVRLTQTLMHFLWEGCIVGLCAYLLTSLSRTANARMRYGIHAGSVVLMVLCVPITFVLVKPQSLAQSERVTIGDGSPVSEHAATVPNKASFVPRPNVWSTTETDTQLPIGSYAHIDLSTEQPSPKPIIEIDGSIPAGEGSQFTNLLRGVSPYAACFYFMGVIVMLGRLCCALWGGHRLRRCAIPLRDHELLLHICQQARRIGLKFAPLVAYCERITIPVVAGICRPVILLPAWVAAELDAEQLLVILAHEMAHIRRFDLLLNVFQRLVETVLFFHPAVWYASRQISVERENCCDDAVIQAGHESVQYASILVRMAELCATTRQPVPSAHLAMLAANGGNVSQFKRRILRLLNGEQPLRLTRADSFALTLVAGLIAAMIAGVCHQASAVASNELTASASLSAEDQSSVDTKTKTNLSTPNANTPTDQLPPGVVQRFRVDLYRVPGWYKFVDVSADGLSIFVLADQQLKVLDRETGAPINDTRFNLGSGAVLKMATSADGKLIVAAMTDIASNANPENDRIVVLSTESNLRQELPWKGRRGDVSMLTVSSDKKTVVTSTEADGLKFWSLESGQEIAKPAWPELRVRSAAFSPDGQFVVLVGARKAVIWRWQASEEPRELFHQRDDELMSVKFSPDGKWFVVGYGAVANGFRIFDAITGKMAWHIDSNADRWARNGGVAFTPDNRFLMVPMAELNCVEMWDMETRQQVRSFEIEDARQITLTRDGKWLIAAGSFGFIRIWNAITGELVVTEPVSRHEGIRQICFSPDGRTMITAGNDGAARVWDVTSGKQKHRLDHKPILVSLAVSPDGRLLVTSTSNMLGVWELSTGNLLHNLTGHGQYGASRPVQFTPDGKEFVSWGNDLQIYRWNSANGKRLDAHVTNMPDPKLLARKIGLPDDYPDFRTGRFSEDAKTLLIDTALGKLYEFEVATGKERRKFGIELQLQRAAVSPDGLWIASSYQRLPADPMKPRERILTLQHRQSLEVAWQFTEPASLVGKRVFSPDSKSLAYEIANSDGGKITWLIEIIDVSTGEVIARIPEARGCDAIQFSPDGKRFATAHCNASLSTILLWDIAKFKIKSEAKGIKPAAEPGEKMD